MLPVHHEPHIWYIKPHAERIRANNDRHRWLNATRELTEQHITVLGSSVPRMKKRHSQSQGVEPHLQILPDLDGRHEDHGATRGHDLEQPLYDLEPRSVVLHGEPQQSDVGSVHAADDYAGIG